MAKNEIAIDAYAGQPREWLLARRKKLLDQIAAHGPGAVASTSDGGLSVSYRTVLATDELRAVNYALAGRTQEDVEAESATAGGTAIGGFVPAEIY